jgi:hypothetical protein
MLHLMPHVDLRRRYGSARTRRQEVAMVLENRESKTGEQWRKAMTEKNAASREG